MRESVLESWTDEAAEGRYFRKKEVCLLIKTRSASTQPLDILVKTCMDKCERPRAEQFFYVRLCRLSVSMDKLLFVDQIERC